MNKPNYTLFLLLLISLWNLAAGSQSGPLAVRTSEIISLDGSDWHLATDPKNIGREEKWWNGVQPEAKQAKVPWVIEDYFPWYDGVVWYWKKLAIPENIHKDGRTLLKFWAVDFKGDVWLNGQYLGGHECGETPFTLDATDAVRRGGENLLAVRVLNPGTTPIDGIELTKTPHRCKSEGVYNHGGIVDSVELILAPAVRIADVYVMPDRHTGKLNVEVSVQNSTKKDQNVTLELSAAPAAGGLAIQTLQMETTAAPGDSRIRAELTIDNPRLWELNDPYLYRVTARLTADEYSESIDESTVKTGFREFAFQEGYFRLNGRRLFLKCAHTGNCCPIGFQIPHDPDLLRRDLLNWKVMGFNMIRFLAGIPTRYQLDLADEIGLMMYEESYASWCMRYSPRFEEWFDQSVREMILRDRNHPSVTAWGLLNETGYGAVMVHATQTLKLVRSLDMDRLVFLNSGHPVWHYAGNTPKAPEGLVSLHLRGVGEPCVTSVLGDKEISYAGTMWRPGQLVLHPGGGGEYAVVRWQAPEDAVCDIQAGFWAQTAPSPTTDGHVLHNGKILFDGYVNVNDGGKEAKFKGQVKVAKGDTVDFALGFGNGYYSADATDFAAVITTDSGKTYDAGRDFSATENPNGPWSYGMFFAGPIDASSFKPFINEALEEIGADRLQPGTLSNPGSLVWESDLKDGHHYKRVPHRLPELNELRTVGDGEPFFMSEYGVGSGQNWMRIVRQFGQYGYLHIDSGINHKNYCDRFLADYEKWGMDAIFGRPEEFLQQSIAFMACERTRGINALRSNPNMVGISLTGAVDQGDSGEGLFTTFREFKPGTMDVIFDGWAKLRWCTFVEPYNIYGGNEVKLEVVLSNEDQLQSGDYPARVWVFGPENQKIFEKDFTVTIPEGEPPFALPVFQQKIAVSGPTGKYRLVVDFVDAGAAGGGESEFYVLNKSEMPPVASELVLWGEDAELERWLKENKIPCRKFDASAPVETKQLILAGAGAAAPGGEAAFADLTRRIENGSHVIFLNHEIFQRDQDTTAFLPLAENKGKFGTQEQWVYHTNQWAASHPVFDGLQRGSLMDYTYYREIIPDKYLMEIDKPAEVIAGGNNVTRCTISSGLMCAIFERGQGRFLMNTMLVKENLGKVPQAERLLRNMINYMAIVK